MDSPVHLKVVYHSNNGKPVVINTDLKATRRIWEVTLKKLLTISTVEEKGLGRVKMFDLDAHKAGVRPILDGEFKVIQLDDNPTWFIKIGFKLPYEVKTGMI